MRRVPLILFLLCTACAAVSAANTADQPAAPPQIQEAAPQYLLIPAESVAKIGALIQRQQAEIERLKRGTGCASGNAEKS